MNITNKGFTLIELIVVMAIIAILVLLAAPRFLGYTKDANVTAMQQDTKVLSDAVEIYHIDSGEWPVSSKITSHGVGGIDELYAIDESKLEGSIKNIRGSYTDYGIAINGQHEGQVFHLDGIEDKDGHKKHGVHSTENLPIKFKGKDYSSVLDVPEDDISLYDYVEMEGFYVLTGFNELYIDEELDGVIPNEISLPSQYKGKPVREIASGKRFEYGVYEPTFSDIKTLIIPNTIQRIGAYSFSVNQHEGKGIEGPLYIPNSVNYIGERAFIFNNITDLRLPNKLKEIKVGTFMDNQIQKVILPKSIEYVGVSAFRLNQLTNVSILNPQIKIDAAAFENNGPQKISKNIIESGRWKLEDNVNWVKMN